LKISIKLSRTNQEKELNLNKGSTVQDILKKIDIKPDTVIVMNKNRPIPIDEKIRENDQLTIIQVSSGG
jgi:sulfur carrier protein ThiS